MTLREPPAMPTIGAVIPVWNGARYLAEAISSLLAQQATWSQIIVVDDGSTDASAEIAGAFGPPVTVQRQPNRGIAAARNAGVRALSCSLVAFLDADDLRVANSLAPQIARFADDASLELCFGAMQQFVSPELDAKTRARLVCPAAPGPACTSGTMVARREVFVRYGLFDESLRAGEFIDWITRAKAARVKFSIVEDLVMLRRLHGANHGIVRRDSYDDYVRVVKRALDAKRAAKVNEGSAAPNAPDPNRGNDAGRPKS